MVKRSKKSKSKRVSLKQKYKVIRKVKEHHKKKAKEAKKLGLNRKRKVEKDPGIPNDWPFKEQELKALEVRRARALEELEQKKAARKERAKKRKMGLLEDDEKEQSIQEIKGINDSTIPKRSPWYRCVDMEKMVMKLGPDKHLVLLLNKIDLVPREAVEKWLKYLREELPAVAFKCSTQEQRSNLGWKSSSKAAKTSNLCKLVIVLERKLSLLEKMPRGQCWFYSRVDKINARGSIGQECKLLDCPGVVMLRSEGNDSSIALRNCKRIEKLDDPAGPVNEIFKLCPERLLVTIYKIPGFQSVDEFLQNVATVRGKLKKGGIVDVEAAARIILHDWNEGKIPYYTMPPVRNQEEPSEARIVTELGKEFNVDEVYNRESSFIGSLKSTNDFHSIEVPPSLPLKFDETMLEDDAQPLPSTEGNEKQEETFDEGDNDEPMASEEDTEKAKSKSATSRQNEKLYAVEGMLNTKMKRAENKKRRKAKSKLTSGDDAMDDDDDYDFGVDYVKGKDQTTGGVPMSGLEVDE
ncbi:Guanine nucleotide-binding protein-like NSN1 [Hibiscus syriacus]|uniref:Guanine nucleotide-binding protein-like NSN1 n=1 Tax=Hibiscus syriacus TaxID=106335 RepID=A0A6A2WP91_HIBSY|nr:Guanine nucleotide-binding protein-like NSN1 [Hibiscus syriacus]